MPVSQLTNSESPKQYIGSERDRIFAAMPQKRDLRPLVHFCIFLVILCLAFSKSLLDLLRYSLESGLFSHVLLVPFISIYLVWLKRNHLPRDWEKSPVSGTTSLMAGLLILAGYWIAKFQGCNPGRNDSLSIIVLSFLSIFLGGGLIILGRRTMRLSAFPVAFLFFMIPFPVFIVEGIETFFQHASADAASALFSLSGTPVFRQGLAFRFPVIIIEVARECSGIHSSLVLFISSLLAGYIFIRKPWKRAVLTFAVIPLGIVRNGFRIFTIAMLCVHVDPEMINSPLHRRGGPVFFALSLLPFFALLFLLQKSEKPAVKIRNLEPSIQPLKRALCGEKIIPG